MAKIVQDMNDLSNFGSYLCGTCQRLKRNFSPVTGVCDDCGRMTSFSVYRICFACAERRCQCQSCKAYCVAAQEEAAHAQKK